MTNDNVRGFAIAYLEDVEVGPEILEYMSQVESTFVPFGGQWLVHGTLPQVLEGPLPGNVVIIEFPSAGHAHRWYASPDYQEIIGLRAEHSRSVLAVLTGVAPGYRAEETVAQLRSAVESGSD
ncbi:DUF1330 domain-containing protein [Occultella glacieicola]|uniref:DUF1330 domain-containing protein n=1 Tax=Occultella glacieicola TaxID=2518684 RepID=A0ABY2DYI0_9MICO|nr:DUF1330 domain-containing protein [Occultella glacieicola]TDE89542.1 DUF1330 domain-containing protein [Occultella glacieicola]